MSASAAATARSPRQRRSLLNEAWWIHLWIHMCTTVCPEGRDTVAEQNVLVVLVGWARIGGWEKGRKGEDAFPLGRCGRQEMERKQSLCAQDHL